MRFLVALALVAPALASPIAPAAEHTPAARAIEERQAASSSVYRWTSTYTSVYTVSGTGRPPTTSTSSARSLTTAAPSTSTSKSASSAAAPAQSSAPAATGGEDTANAAQFLKLHNDFRAHYGASAMTWNSTLAKYAYKAASTCTYGHTNGPYGENIAAGAGGGYNIDAGFNSWAANEAKLYDWNNPGYSSQTGHFTQIVWKASNQVGCAAVSCADGKIFTGYGPSLYLVCEYAPPGNWVSSNSATTAQYFRTNVGVYQA